MGHLLPSARQFRVPADAALLVVMALAVTAEVDGVGVHVDVHEVVDNFTLDVILHPVDQETAADIDDLDEGQAPVCREDKTQCVRPKDWRGYLVLLVQSACDDTPSQTCHRDFKIRMRKAL